LRRNGKIIISLPNFKYRVMNIDAFSQEHTVYPTDEILTNFLIEQGFEIINKKFYLKHSTFYSIRPLIKEKNVVLLDSFKQSKKLISEYSKRLNRLCRFYKNNLQNKAYYIFSAHIFAQILLFYCGLPIKKCLGFLDNAEVKHSGYLYGTNLKCYPPSKIKNDKDPVVIASAFTYSKEISKQLKSINKKVEIL